MTQDEADARYDELLSSIDQNPTSPGDAISTIVAYGGYDGSHHKQWVLDQVLRDLAGTRYTELVELMCYGEDGPETYDWDEGVPP